MGNAKSSSQHRQGGTATANAGGPDPKSSVAQQRRTPPPPKHLLWGCKTSEAHYEYVEAALKKIQEMRSLKRKRKEDDDNESNDDLNEDDDKKAAASSETLMALLGFEYRVVHCSNCKCVGGRRYRNEMVAQVQQQQQQQQQQQPKVQSSLSSAKRGGEEEEKEQADNPLSSENDDDDDDSLDDDDHDYVLGKCYMAPIASGEDQPRPQSDSKDAESERSPGGEQLDDLRVNKTLVLSASALDLLALRYEAMTETERVHSKRMSRVKSAASMFSLATHHSTLSGGTSFGYGGDGGGDDEYRNDGYGYGADETEVGDGNVESQGCGYRLFHVPSGGTLVSEDNWQTYVAPGKMYDEVARLCMDAAQQVMIDEGDLEWITVEEAQETEEETAASGSQERSPTAGGDNNNRGTICALVSRGRSRGYGNRNSNVLLVVTGKGEVGAGIFSRRHLITSGMEVSTALPFVREALRRDMHVVVLDPNARGWKSGLGTVRKSLEKLFLCPNSNHDGNWDNNKDAKEETICVLAHSMAGSQIARILHDAVAKAASPQEKEGWLSLQNRMKAIAFTDSNHNVNWVKDNAALIKLLQGPASIYVKSHRVHEDAKALGELHHQCDFWKRRFGSIKT